MCDTVDFEIPNLIGEVLPNTNELKILSIIGYGSFAVVYKAQDADGVLFAVKCIVKKGLNEFQLNLQYREVELLQELNDHPNIIKLYQIIDTKENLFLVLDLCECDLFEAIVHNHGFNNEYTKEVFITLIETVEYLHKKHIYHRDLKPENILITYSGEIKIADFGLACMDDWSTDFDCGTLRYEPPECVDMNSIGYYPEQSDIWALGVILINLRFERNPWSYASSEDHIYREYISNNPNILQQQLGLSNELNSILKQLFNEDPNKRCSLLEFKNAIMNINEMYDYSKYNPINPVASTETPRTEESSTEITTPTTIVASKSLYAETETIVSSINGQSYSEIKKSYLDVADSDLTVANTEKDALTTTISTNVEQNTKATTETTTTTIVNTTTNNIESSTSSKITKTPISASPPTSPPISTLSTTFSSIETKYNYYDTKIKYYSKSAFDNNNDDDDDDDSFFNNEIIFEDQKKMIHNSNNNNNKTSNPIDIIFDKSKNTNKYYDSNNSYYIASELSYWDGNHRDQSNKMKNENDTGSSYYTTASETSYYDNNGSGQNKMINKDNCNDNSFCNDEYYQNNMFEFDETIASFIDVGYEKCQKDTSSSSIFGDVDNETSYNMSMGFKPTVLGFWKNNSSCVGGGDTLREYSSIIPLSWEDDDDDYDDNKEDDLIQDRNNSVVPDSWEDCNFEEENESNYYEANENNDHYKQNISDFSKMNDNNSDSSENDDAVVDVSYKSILKLNDDKEKSTSFYSLLTNPFFEDESENENNDFKNYDGSLVKESNRNVNNKNSKDSFTENEDENYKNNVKNNVYCEYIKKYKDFYRDNDKNNNEYYFEENDNEYEYEKTERNTDENICERSETIKNYTKVRESNSEESLDTIFEIDISGKGLLSSTKQEASQEAIYNTNGKSNIEIEDGMKNLTINDKKIPLNKESNQNQPYYNVLNKNNPKDINRLSRNNHKINKGINKMNRKPPLFELFHKDIAKENPLSIMEYKFNNPIQLNFQLNEKFNRSKYLNFSHYYLDSLLSKTINKEEENTIESECTLNKSRGRKRNILQSSLISHKRNNDQCNTTCTNKVSNINRKINNFRNKNKNKYRYINNKGINNDFIKNDILSTKTTTVEPTISLTTTIKNNYTKTLESITTVISTSTIGSTTNLTNNNDILRKDEIKNNYINKKLTTICFNNNNNKIDYYNGTLLHSINNKYYEQQQQQQTILYKYGIECYILILQKIITYFSAFWISLKKCYYYSKIESNRNHMIKYCNILENVISSLMNMIKKMVTYTYPIFSILKNSYCHIGNLNIFLFNKMNQIGLFLINYHNRHIKAKYVQIHEIVKKNHVITEIMNISILMCQKIRFYILLYFAFIQEDKNKFNSNFMMRLIKNRNEKRNRDDKFIQNYTRKILIFFYFFFYKILYLLINLMKNSMANQKSKKNSKESFMFSNFIIKISSIK